MLRGRTVGNLRAGDQQQRIAAQFLELLHNLNGEVDVGMQLLIEIAVKAPATAPTYNLLGTVVTAPIDTRARQEFEVTIAVRNALN